MVSENTVALLTTGGAGAVGVAQFIAVKQLVDKKVSMKPLGSFNVSFAKGLNEWTTMASLVGGLGALGYVLYDVEYKKRPLSDTSMALASYSIVSLTAGVLNALLDPMGSSGVSLDISKLKNLFGGKSGGIASGIAPKAKFIR